MNTAPKYVEATTQAQTTIENDDGFYMGKGAQVRIPTTVQDGYDATGIRFTVNLQAEYITQLNNTYQDVTFYSIIAINGAEAVVPETFTGESDTTVIGNVALLKWAENDYGKLLDGWYTRNITPTNMQKGFDIALTVRAVAKVVKADNSVDYLYAKLNDNTRTMEAVALESYLDNADDPDYAYLNKYYGTATPYTGGYAEETGESVVSFVDNLTNVELSDKAYACVGASPVDLTDGVVNLDSSVANLEVGKTYNVSIFDGDKVYTKPMMYVTQTINEASDLSVFELVDKDITGYYVVTEDIDASEEDVITHSGYIDATDGYTYRFKGVFDGNEHTIKANVQNGGLLGSLEDAKVFDANFVFNISESTISADNFPVGLAYKSSNSTISNIYAELNIGNNVTAANNRNWALALLVDGGTTTKIENAVVVNNDNFETLRGNTTSHWLGGALIYADGARTSNVRNTHRTNIYLIAPERIGNATNGYGYYVPLSGGTTGQGFASNDTVGMADAATKTGKTQYLYENVTRYNTTFNFVDSLVWENNIPDFIMKGLLDDGTIVSVGETKIVNNGEVELPLNVAQAVTLSIGTKALTNVELSSEDDCITISGTSLTLTKVGTATVTATGKFDDMTVTVTFTVSLDATTYEEKVLFSGMDGDVDVKTIFGEGAVLASAYGLDGTEYTVADGKISGLTNTTNEAVEKTVLLATTANEYKYVNFIVYTKLIDDAQDLTVFALTSELTADIIGCYLVTKDIDASGEDAIAHTTIEGYDTTFDYAFTGVFDGNGKTITVKTAIGGLFGNLKNASITNANFVFNITGARLRTTDKFPSGLAHTVSGNQATTTISNVYAELNIGEGLTDVSARSVWALSLIVSADKSLALNNVVVVNNDDFENLQPDSTGWVAGALINLHSGRTDAGYRNAHLTNVFVVAPERLGKADDGTGNPTSNYAYYVPMSGRTATQAFASNDTAGVEAAKVNTGNSTQYTYAGVTRYSNVNTFVDGNAWSGIIPDSVMDAVRLHYVTNN